MGTTKNLKEACEQYLEHLKAVGKKPSTLGTARRTLDLLISEMGEDKEVKKILPLHVDKFFKSEAATMQPGKDGLNPRPLAGPSDKLNAALSRESLQTERISERPWMGPIRQDVWKAGYALS